MKKFLFIAFVAVLVLGWILASLHREYFPYWKESKLTRLLQQSGYEVITETMRHGDPPPFADRLSPSHREVPRTVTIRPGADLSVLPKLETCPMIFRLNAEVNLSTEAWNQLSEWPSYVLGIGPAQDPEAFLSSHTMRYARMPVELTASNEEHRLSPERVERWLNSSRIIHKLSLVAGDEELLPLLPLVFKKVKSLDVRNVPLSQQDLAPLDGSSCAIHFENTGVEASWIPATYNGKRITLIGKDIPEKELDHLAGEFSRELTVESSDADEATKERLGKAGVSLRLLRDL